MSANRKGIEFQTWRNLPRLTSQLQLYHSGEICMLDKQLLAQKSEKIAMKLQKNPREELSRLLGDINADQESMELLARFCHGFDITLSPENAVPVACLAHSLSMTDTFSPNNLLNKAISFFKKHIMNSWNNTIKALKSAETVLRQAEELGLTDCCVETLILKALEDPRLLGEPLKKDDEEEDDDDDNDDDKPFIKLNTRRKLFEIECRSEEDLTSLPLRFYAPIVHAMIKKQVRPEYVTANLCRYAKTWVFCYEDVQFEKVDAQRETVEVLVKLLPLQVGLVPCTFLCEMLRFAMAVEANAECRDSLEMRIGLQLEEASSKDLLVPCHGYSNQEKYDTECLRRIVMHFYSKPTFGRGEMVAVSELIDDFLAEIAADIDLSAATFLKVAELSTAAAEAVQRGGVGLYKAIDVFLEKHRHLTETEKENLCRVLDCSKLPMEALEHAAANERLPVRVVMQALFASQLKLKEAMVPKGIMVQGGGERLMLKMEAEGEEEEEEEDGMRMEMEKIGSKVSELERECMVMRREIERRGGAKNQKQKQKRSSNKMSMWKEMKRKFGCLTTSVSDCDCHVKNKKKKVHPR